MLNPTGGNCKPSHHSLTTRQKESFMADATVGGKCGYVWGGTALFCLIVAYFGLPEYKGRSYRELDILFARRVSARKFSSTQVSIEDDE